jgi:TolA-binding protein
MTDAFSLRPRRRRGAPRAPDCARTGGRLVPLLSRLALLLCCCAPPAPARDERSSDLTLAAGRAALEDGLYDLAEKHFFDLVRRPDLAAATGVEATLSLARALYEQEKYEDLLAALSENQPWVKRLSDPSGTLYWRALALFRNGDAAAADTLLDRLIAGYPTSPHRRFAERAKAWIHLEARRTDAALAAFKRFDQLPGDEADTAANRLEWGRVLVTERQFAEAETVLQSLIALPNLLPETALAGRYWLGRARMGLKQWEAALADLTVPTVAPHSEDDLAARAFYAQASVYMSLTNASAALAALSNGLARARSPEIRRRGQTQTGMTLLDLNRVEEAHALIQAFAAAEPQTPEAAMLQLMLAETLLAQGRHVEAENEFRLYLKVFSAPQDQARAAKGLAWALYGAGRHAEAAASFLKAYEISDDLAFRGRALFKAGDAYLANDQFEQAGAMYARLLREQPDSPLAPQAMLQFAHSLTRSEKIERALETLHELAQRYPDSDWAETALFRQAELLETQGRSDEAIDIFGRLATAQPRSARHADARLARGLILYRQFALRAALADFEAILQNFAQTEAAERAFYMRGLCLYRMMRDEEMLRILNEFLQRYPQSDWTPQVMFHLGQYYHNQERYAEAEKHFLTLAEQFPQHSLADHALLRAARAAARRKEYREAIALFARLAQSYPASVWLPETRFGQAEALRQLARYAEAILFYRELRNRHPDSDLVPLSWIREGDSHFMLGVEETGRYREALRAYRAVAGDPAVHRNRPEWLYEAEYKIGRCLEKLDLPDEALDQYYAKTLVRYLQERQQGVRHDEATRRWFERATFSTADLLEARKDWRQMVAVLERAVEAGSPSAEAMRQRIQKARSEYFWLFY